MLRDHFSDRLLAELVGAAECGLGQGSGLSKESTTLAVTTAAFAGSTGWSQHRCNVANVTWARTHPHTLAIKAKYVVYLKQLTKQHGCNFPHLP